MLTLEEKKQTNKSCNDAPVLRPLEQILNRRYLQLSEKKFLQLECTMIKALHNSQCKTLKAISWVKLSDACFM